MYSDAAACACRKAPFRFGSPQQAKHQTVLYCQPSRHRLQWGQGAATHERSASDSAAISCWPCPSSLAAL
jgi:hypothetical protein